MPIKKLSLLIFSLSLLILSAHRTEAIGMSPPVVDMPHVLKGGSQSATISIFRDGGTTGDINIVVSPRGEFARYVNAPTDMVIPDGKDSAEYTLQVAPKDAAIGSYQVLLDFFQTEKKATSTGQNKNGALNTQVSVIRGATAIVRFTVSGDQVLSYKLVNLQAMDSEIGMSLSFKYSVENTGNVDWKPSKIEITVTDTIDPTKTANFTVDGKDLDLIAPGQVSGSSFELKHSLLEGTYEARAVFYDNDKVAGTMSSQKFRIFPPGTLKQSGELISLKANKDKYKAGEKIKLTADFKNTGAISSKGLLVTEVYQNQELLDILRSTEVDANKGEETELSQIVTLLKGGDYTLSSYVEYGNRKTASKSVSIVIEGESKSMMVYAGGFLGIVIIIAMLVAFFI